MSLKGTTLSKEGLEYLCGLINKIVSSPKDLLDDINLATNTTFSSVRIDSLIADTLQQANTHAEALCNALTKLTCEKTTTKPVLNGVEKNVIYLYSSDGNPPFDQYLKISDTELIDLGSTSISLNDYLTVTDAIATYCKKTDFNSLKTEVDKVKTDLTTHTIDTNIHVTTSDKTKWNEVDNKVDKTDITTSIDSSSKDSQVPSAKAIYNKSKNRLPQLPNGTDVIEYAETFGGEFVTETVRLKDATNSPYGVNNTSNDFYYTIYNMGDSKFKRVVAYDVRSNSMYMIMKHGGTWGTWQRVCTTSVADVPLTNIKPTLPSTVKSGNSKVIRYSIKNGWANVTIILNLIASPKFSWTSVATGLPKSDDTIYSVVSYGENGINNASVGFRLVSNGELQMLVGSEITKNDWWNLSFSYPVKEQ